MADDLLQFVDTRKVVCQVEQIWAQDEAQLTRPVARAWAAAVLSASALEGQVLTTLADLGAALGDRLGRLALDALRRHDDSVVLAYGKGAVVGAGVPLEWGPAVLHPKLGKPLRALIGQGKAVIPSTIKRGVPGTRLDIPLHGADDEWDFTMMDAVEVSLPDAPSTGEIVVIVALACGGRAGALAL